MTTQIPSGWYPDPYGSPQLRWWNGSQWTDATHPADAPAGQAASPAPQTGSSPQPTGSQPTGPYPAGPQPGTAGPADLAGPPPGPAGPPPELTGPPPVPAGQWNQSAMPLQGPETARSEQPQWGGQPAGNTMQMPAVEFGYPSGPPPRKSNPLPWILGGGGVVILIVAIVVAAMFLVNPDDPTTASNPTPVPTATTQEPGFEPTPEPTPTEEPTGSTPPQPQDGLIRDPGTGLSYAFPGKPWEVPDSTGRDSLGFEWTSAAIAVSHDDFDGEGHKWLGNIFTGLLPNQLGYTGPASMRGIVATLMHGVEETYYSPPHTRKIVENKPIKVSGKDAWLFVFDLDFSKESEANGWKWKKERAAFVIVDRGPGTRAALVYISVPDNLDISVADRVVKSLKLS